MTGTNHYYLVIEEINRGNAPAIFGDVFQLLDRKNGESDYRINNEYIAGFVYGEDEKEEKIRIPKNLSIYATMNTSDQNVFTLDTAFKRRWEMEHIENDVDNCDIADLEVCKSGIKWKTFAGKINDLIIELNSDKFGNEDNRLGAYFVNENELNDSKRFGEKVLMYLWNDAFKYDRDKVFKSEYRTLDELIKGFNDNGMKVFENVIDFTVHNSSGQITLEKFNVGVSESNDL